MAVPITPENYILQQGNGQAYLSWDITPTATAYQVQRSTNGVSYSVIASPTINEYLDTTVTVGTLYYYKVAATNGDGNSPYTDAQSCVPAYSGDLSLGQIRLTAKQEADMVNSAFVSTPEWNNYINQSAYELYDLLTTIYEDYNVNVVPFTTVANQQFYDLPNGSNYSGARPFYKLLGVDLGINTNQNGYVSIKKFNFIDRNKYFFPNTNSTIYGVYNLQYRVMGNQLELIPIPSSNQPMKIWYIPRMVQLLKDTDLLQGVSGWTEYVIVDAAMKAMLKEESDASALAARKMALEQRIRASASNRDAGQTDTISDTRSAGGFGGGFYGGWGRGGW